MRLANAWFWSSILFTQPSYFVGRGVCGGCGGRPQGMCDFRFLTRDRTSQCLLSWKYRVLIIEPPRKSLHTHLLMWSFPPPQTISLYDSFLCHFHAPLKLHSISLSAQYRSPCSFLNQNALIESLNISLYIYPPKKKHRFKERSSPKAFLFESWNRKTDLG